jgi:hypothetical protein
MFIHAGDTITIDGFKIPLDLFMRLEPTYTYPSNLKILRYDGVCRQYKAGDRNWTIEGKWEQGDRYVSRLKDFKQLLAQERAERQALEAEVAKAKYPLEEPVNVQLQQRDDLNAGGTEGVRPKSKRAPRRRSEHNG